MGEVYDNIVLKTPLRQSLSVSNSIGKSKLKGVLLRLLGYH